jgi:hypothetical protein
MCGHGKQHAQGGTKAESEGKMIHKRRGSKYYSYKFMYREELYSESTKQSNAKVAKEIEAAKRAELAKGEVGTFERKSIANLKEFCDRWFSPRISGTVGGFIKQKTGRFPQDWDQRAVGV